MLTHLFAAFAAVFFYQSISFSVRFARSRSPELFWSTAFATLSCVHVALFIPFYTWDDARLALLEEWHVPLSFLVLATYLKTLKNYFAPGSRVMGWAAGTIVVITAGTVAAGLYGGAVGESLLINARSIDFDHPFAPVSFIRSFTLSPALNNAHTTVRLLVLVALVHLVATGRVHRDRVMQLGVFASIAILVHNFVTVHWALAFYLPLLPFMNAIELSRFEWMARRGESLSLRHKEEQIASLNSELAQHQHLRRLGEQAGALIHDLQNHLVPILYELEDIKAIAEETDNEALAARARGVERSTDDILDFLKETKQRKLETGTVECVELVTVVDEAVAMVRHRLDEHSIRIAVVNHADKAVSVDRAETTRAFANLFNNACDAIAKDESPWNEVRIDEWNGAVRAAVSNSGEKISRDLFDRIFEPFFTTKKESGGSGFGLYSSRRSLERSHASLSLNKESEHTRFDVVFHALAAADG